MIAIIDYDLGNLNSIVNMLKVIGEKSVITDDQEVIQRSDKIILPGVGAFDAGMNNLNRKGLTKVIRTAALEDGKPILGICLGMQLLGRKSEEGAQEGIGLIPFNNQKFQIESEGKLKVPHMGWDIVKIKQKNSLTDELREQQRYYFVHSYHAVCDDESNVLMTCEYGYEFAAAVVKDNIFGVQFHPEKSHDFGMMLLKNFAQKC